MKAAAVLVQSIVVTACLAGLARADDAGGGDASYKQKMHDCVTQMKTDHPDMNYKARHKACHKQLGPSPKSQAAMPSASPKTPP